MGYAGGALVGAQALKDYKIVTKSYIQFRFHFQQMSYMRRHICDLSIFDLVPFVQFKKKREMHPWKSNTFSKVAGFRLQLY